MSVAALRGSRVLVTGVTGNVGWGVARALLDAGARVHGVTRAAASADAIKASLDHHPQLQVEVADLSDPEAAFGLRDRVADAGPVDHVVASLGSWWQKGDVADQTPAEYAAVRAASLDAQVHVAMAFLPPLRQRPGASYTMITGAGGHLSIPGTGLLVVAVSGVFGLSRMLRQEHAHAAVRVNEVLIRTRIEREQRPGVTPAAGFGVALAELLAGDVRSAVMHFDGGKALTPGAVA